MNIIKYFLVKPSIVNMRLCTSIFSTSCLFEWVKDNSMWWSYILGYLFAVAVAHFPISRVVAQMKESINQQINKNSRGPEYWQPVAIGWVERVLYVTSFQLGEPEFIGIWLTLKVAAQWKRWTGDGDNSGGGRFIFNIFLLRNALSIGYAVTGAKLIEWSLSSKWEPVIGIPISLLLATSVFWWWLKRMRR